jgi:hypothetical protein
MFVALAWADPVQGVVTGVLCPTHERPVHAAFAELDLPELASRSWMTS